MASVDPEQRAAALSNGQATTVNPFLGRLMRTLRADRRPLPGDKPFYVRMDRAGRGTFAQLWFLTRGCTWDRRGACTMCNYGHAAPLSEETMVDFVRRGLETIRGPVDELFVSPSGSMLDPAEVPPGARDRIFQAASSFECSKVSMETRAETVTPQLADELTAAMTGKRIAVGIGLESSSQWILRWCINRMGDRSAFAEAAELLRTRDVEVYANVSLGSAFLTAAEAIEDACETVRWALRHGATMALVFPMHVKRHTLLAWLWERGLYRPPSLWSLVEVLSRIGPELLRRVNISWYRSDYGDGSAVVASPSTCPRCRLQVLTLLDRYRADPSPGTLQDLQVLECGCRDAWRKECEREPKAQLPERVLGRYEEIARETGLVDWWQAHGPKIREELLQPDRSAVRA